jgi:hypothetical protein
MKMHEDLTIMHCSSCTAEDEGVSVMWMPGGTTSLLPIILCRLWLSFHKLKLWYKDIDFTLATNIALLPFNITPVG